MTILITVLITIASLIALLLIIALFTKKTYVVGREIIINKPTSDVFNYVRYIKNQDHFNKWTMIDPNMKKIYRGTDGSVGFVYGWNGNKQAGEGEQEIMGITEGEKLDLEVRFVRPFPAVAKTPMTIEAVGGSQTKVNWTMTSSMKYPMNIMLAFMNMDKLLGKDLETSMGMLKRHCGKKLVSWPALLLFVGACSI